MPSSNTNQLTGIYRGQDPIIASRVREREGRGRSAQSALESPKEESRSGLGSGLGSSRSKLELRSRSRGSTLLSSRGQGLQSLIARQNQLRRPIKSTYQIRALAILALQRAYQISLRSLQYRGRYQRQLLKQEQRRIRQQIDSTLGLQRYRGKGVLKTQRQKKKALTLVLPIQSYIIIELIYFGSFLY